MSDDIQQKIDTLVKSHPIVLFMKGNASFPMCGFSGRAVQLLKSAGADSNAVYTVNVLEDEAVRQGIKTYSNWPTIPQLYVKGEFIGGSDIMQEMYEQGELQTLLAGRPAPQELVCYCGSGVSTVPNIIALELAGYESPVMYAGSWSEWTRTPGAEIEKG